MKKISIALIIAIVFLIIGSVGAIRWDISKWLGETLLEAVFRLFIELLLPSFQSWLLTVWGLLTFSPRFACWPGATGCTVSYGVDRLLPYFLSILIPIYVVAVLFTALFFMVRAGSPQGRARARSMFIKLIYGMLLVILSPLIYQAMIDVSYRMTTSILGPVSLPYTSLPVVGSVKLFPSGLEDMLRDAINKASFGNAVGVLILLITGWIAVIGLWIVMSLRYFFVFIYGVLFPFILFLYSFEVTKPYGRRYFRKAIKWIFVPVIQALIMAFTVATATSLGNPTLSGVSGSIGSLIGIIMGWLSIVGGMVLAVIAPLIMAKVLDWFGNGLIFFGAATGNVWAMAWGGILSGHGPQALLPAHAEFSRTRAYELYRPAIHGYPFSPPGAEMTMRYSPETGPADRRTGMRGVVVGPGGLGPEEPSGRETRPIVHGAIPERETIEGERIIRRTRMAREEIEPGAPPITTRKKIEEGAEGREAYEYGAERREPEIPREEELREGAVGVPRTEEEAPTPEEVKGAMEETREGEGGLSPEEVGEELKARKGGRGYEEEVKGALVEEGVTERWEELAEPQTPSGEEIEEAHREGVSEEAEAKKRAAREEGKRKEEAAREEARAKKEAARKAAKVAERIELEKEEEKKRRAREERGKPTEE